MRLRLCFLFVLALFCAPSAAEAAGTAQLVSVDSETLGQWMYPEDAVWKYRYGAGGHIIFFGTETIETGRPAQWAEDIRALPDYAEVATQPGFSYYVNQQDSKDPRALVMPFSETRKSISCYNYESCRLDIRITDGKKHLVTVYTAGFGTNKTKNSLILRDTADNPVGSAEIEKNTGTYITVLADSNFSLTLYDGENSSVGFQAVFFDGLLPRGVTGLTAQAWQRTVTLRWNSAPGYDTAVYRRNGENCERIAVVSGNTFTDENLMAGTAYTYQVCSIRGNRISDFSECSVQTEVYEKTTLVFLDGDTAEAEAGECVTVTAALRDAGGNPVPGGTVSVYQKNGQAGALYDSLVGVCTADGGGTLVFTYTAALFGETELKFSYAGSDSGRLAECSAVFRVLVPGRPWESPPVLTKISEEISPGESFSIYGYGIFGDIGVALMPAVGAAAKTPPAGAARIGILCADAPPYGNYVSAVLPAQMRPGVYDVWVKNQYGWSEPIRLNAPVGLFLDEYETAPGFSVKLVGRNLDGGVFGRESLPGVRLAGEAGVYPAAIVRANRTCIEFKADDVPAGTYDVYVNNGPRALWSKLESGQSLTVREQADDPLGLGAVWAGDFNWAAEYNACLDFGILPGTGEDQTGAFQGAVDWIEQQGGGVLYIPAGEYFIKQLALGRGVVVRGDGMEKTILRCAQKVSYCIYLKSSARQDGLVGIDNLGLRLTEPADMPDHFIMLNGAGHGCDKIFIHQVGIDSPYTTAAGTGNAVSVLGLGERLLVSGCRFSGYRGVVSSGYMERYGKLKDNVFQTASGCCALFSEYTTIENNQLVNPGAASGSYDDAQELHGFSIKGNTYFAENQIELGLHMNRQGCGEAVMLETPGAMYAEGGIAAAGPDFVELTNAEQYIENGELLLPEPKYGRLYLAITGGTGMGQVRRVAGAQGKNRVLVGEPWTVVPDGTSTYTLGVFYENTTVYGNTAAQCEAGISFYANCYNCAAIGNTMSNTAGVTSTAFHIPSANRVNANYFIRMEDNRIFDVLAVSGFHGLSGFAYNVAEDTQLFGFEIKGNAVSNSASAYPAENGTALKMQGTMAGDRTCLGVLIEDNTYSGFPRGILIDRGAGGVVVRNNRFADCAQALAAASTGAVWEADGNNGEILSPGPGVGEAVWFFGEQEYIKQDDGMLTLYPVIGNDTPETAAGFLAVCTLKGNACTGVYGQAVSVSPYGVEDGIRLTVPDGGENAVYRLMFWDGQQRPYTAAVNAVSGNGQEKSGLQP